MRVSATGVIPKASKPCVGTRVSECLSADSNSWASLELALDSGTGNASGCQPEGSYGGRAGGRPWSESVEKHTVQSLLEGKLKFSPTLVQGDICLDLVLGSCSELIGLLNIVLLLF